MAAKETMAKARRPDRPNKPKQPPLDPADDDDDGDVAPGAASEPLKRLALVEEALDARLRGEPPTRKQLTACEEERGSERAVHEWNIGRGSQNVAPKARVGLGDYRWIGAWCKYERANGDGHLEHGTPSGRYSTRIESCKLIGQNQLAKLGLDELANDCRLAYRSNQAWKLLCAAPAPRLRDRLIEGGVVRESVARRPARRPTVAWAGMRYTLKNRAAKDGYLTEDAPSESLAAELAMPDRLGLTMEETEIARRCIAGDLNAARIVSSWMIGTIQNEERTWHWRIRRFLPDGSEPGGTEKVYLGADPNPYKKCRTVGQHFLDGTNVGMCPGLPLSNHNALGYRTDIDGGVIHAGCENGPPAELPEMRGRLLYQVDVDGAAVDFIVG